MTSLAARRRCPTTPSTRRSATSSSARRSVARVAQQDGNPDARCPRNPAMVLGGLRTGVTPLEMADSYSTLAHGGRRVSGSLAAYDGGPVALHQGGGRRHPRRQRDQDRAGRFPRAWPRPGDPDPPERHHVRHGPAARRSASSPPARRARPRTTRTPGSSASPNAMTVAVWVGYPDSARPMETEYRGEPVAGGTYPGRDLARLHAVGEEDPRDARVGARQG